MLTEEQIRAVAQRVVTESKGTSERHGSFKAFDGVYLHTREW
jgi:hypothetical protein